MKEKLISSDRRTRSISDRRVPHAATRFAAESELQQRSIEKFILFTPQLRAPVLRANVHNKDGFNLRMYISANAQKYGLVFHKA